jgi:hypothetical protein
MRRSSESQDLQISPRCKIYVVRPARLPARAGDVCVKLNETKEISFTKKVNNFIVASL